MILPIEVYSFIRIIANEHFANIGTIERRFGTPPNRRLTYL